jgi:hypothetical protein
VQGVTDVTPQGGRNEKREKNISIAAEKLFKNYPPARRTMKMRGSELRAGS